MDLRNALRSQGNITAGDTLLALNQLGLNAKQSAEVMKAEQAGAQLDAGKGAKQLLADAEAYLNKNKDNLNATTANTKQLQNQNTQLNASVNSDTAKVKQLEKQKALVDAQLKTLKQQSSEMQAQQQFEKDQADIESQIKLAQASGDYLKAAQLQQEKIGNVAKYTTDTKTQQLQDQSDALNQQIADLKASVSTNQQTISNNTIALQNNTSSTDNNTGQLKQGVIINLKQPGSSASLAIPPVSSQQAQQQDKNIIIPKAINPYLIIFFLLFSFNCSSYFILI